MGLKGKNESVVSIAAAMLVLFVSMIDPCVVCGNFGCGFGRTCGN